MTPEQYCRETAEACGYDLTDAEWADDEFAVGPCLLMYNSDGAPEHDIVWQPHTNAVQALEAARVRGMTLYFDHRGVLCTDEAEVVEVWTDHPTTESAVCTAIMGCWEAGRG